MGQIYMQRRPVRAADPVQASPQTQEEQTPVGSVNPLVAAAGRELLQTPQGMRRLGAMYSNATYGQNAANPFIAAAAAQDEIDSGTRQAIVAAERAQRGGLTPTQYAIQQKNPNDWQERYNEEMVRHRADIARRNDEVGFLRRQASNAAVPVASITRRPASARPRATDEDLANAATMSPTEAADIYTRSNNPVIQGIGTDINQMAENQSTLEGLRAGNPTYISPRSTLSPQQQNTLVRMGARYRSAIPAQQPLAPAPTRDIHDRIAEAEAFQNYQPTAMPAAAPIIARRPAVAPVAAPAIPAAAPQVPVAEVPPQVVPAAPVAPVAPPAPAAPPQPAYVPQPVIRATPEQQKKIAEVGSGMSVGDVAKRFGQNTAEAYGLTGVVPDFNTAAERWKQDVESMPVVGAVAKPVGNLARRAVDATRVERAPQPTPPSQAAAIPETVAPQPQAEQQPQQRFAPPATENPIVAAYRDAVRRRTPAYVPQTDEQRQATDQRIGILRGALSRNVSPGVFEDQQREQDRADALARSGIERRQAELNYLNSRTARNESSGQPREGDLTQGQRFQLETRRSNAQHARTSAEARKLEMQRYTPMSNGSYQNPKDKSVLTKEQYDAEMKSADQQIADADAELQALGGGQQANPQPSGDDGIPTVSTPEEAAKLPKGTRFRTPDGQVRTRN